MTLDQIILWLMACGLLIGAADRMIGNRWGLGEKFEEGFLAMGPIALGMVGMIVLAPAIAQLLSPVIIPVYTGIGADPAMFAGLFAIDMGGYHLAMALAVDEGIGRFSGLVVGSTLGCTAVFSIPVGLGLIAPADRPYFAKGLLAGLVTLPVGSLIGGLVAGFAPGLLAVNLLPVLLLSLVIALGLVAFPEVIIKAFFLFARFIVILITTGLAAAGFESITGVVLLSGLAPIEEALAVVGQIGVLLLGTFPALHLLVRLLDRPLIRLGKKLGLCATGAAGLVFSLANAIPVFKLMDQMTPRGKVLNTAWLVSASSAFGAHLGFTAGVYPAMITPMLVGKLSGGLLALCYALWLVGEPVSPSSRPS